MSWRSSYIQEKALCRNDKQMYKHEKISYWPVIISLWLQFNGFYNGTNKSVENVVSFFEIIKADVETKVIFLKEETKLIEKH